MYPVNTVRARKNFAATVNRAAYGKERVALTRRGKPVAYLIPVEDAEYLAALEERMDLLDAQRALAEFKASGKKAVPLSEALKKRGRRKARRGV